MSLQAPQHSWAYRLRRLLNWLPMGLAYGFLYMGRYNLNVAKGALGDLMTKADFGDIFAVGAMVYGFSFLLNGPLVDRIGGRRGMLICVAGAIAANVAMGLVLFGNVYWGWKFAIVPTFMVLYAINMYFQSYGAVSIITVKTPWFHVRERGTFSTIFGIIITMGIYFAFDWGHAIVQATRATPGELGWIASAFSAVFQLGKSGTDENWMVFFVPAILMASMWIVMALFLRNTPGEAGFEDFDTQEDTLSADGARLPVHRALAKIFTHPVLLFVVLIEFCSGILRQGVMQWYPMYGKEIGVYDSFWITHNWGLALLICGFIGANATGWVSDKVFGSRRAPMAAINYGLMVVGTIVMAIGLGNSLWVAGLAALTISMSVIAVHGIMAGTTTADFGGRKNTGIVVGIVDGVVYLGTALQAFVIGHLAPTGAAAANPTAWRAWPIFLIPFALVGFGLTFKIWNAIPSRMRKAAPETSTDSPVAEASTSTPPAEAA